ncbi:MAG: WbqC family protein [Culturomica sp.]|jgi:hypothetical protein|nr:WbqC family protein [Culturomica sp.]
MNQVILNTAYFPPVQFFGKLKKYRNVLIEQWEHYEKQSYRNRCIIMTANGIMQLTVPIRKPDTDNFFTKDTEIDYSTNWQKIHFKAIESAYKRSPFYDYYIEDFMPFFTDKEKYLLTLNDKIIKKLVELIGLDVEISYSKDFIKQSEDYLDLRNVIHPKKSRRIAEDNDSIYKPYYQTFNDRYTFVPNLSVLDLLFNMGPETADYL